MSGTSSAAVVAHTLAAAFVLSGCGGPRSASPPPAPPVERIPHERLDVFHDVYFRGGPGAPGTPKRVALTFTGLDTCTGPLLSRLREPERGAAPLPATFFFEPAALEVELAAHPDAARAALARLAAEGHGVALEVERFAPAWRADPAAFRAGLGTEIGLLGNILRANSGTFPPGAIPFRGPAGAPDLLTWGATSGRPQVYWSMHADLARELPAALEARFAAEARDGDIIALETAATPGDCGQVEGVVAVAHGLKAAGLAVVPLTTLLGAELGRYEAARLLRYDGPGLAPECARALELPVAEQTGSPGSSDLRGDFVLPRQELMKLDHAPHWGLVGDTLPDGRLVVLPLPRAPGKAALGAPADPAGASALWERRATWRGLPACLVTVSPEHRLSPLSGDARLFLIAGPTPSGGTPPAEAAARRDARVVSAPDRPLVLPTRDDLVRLEARQRLPWRLRGLVAQTLAGLGLETPLLLEARPTVGVAVGAPLAPADVVDRDALRRAVAGYVQVTEASLGEYLFLARLFPADAPRLERAARGGDGFLRVGPYLVLRGAPGEAPSPRHLGVTGGPIEDEPGAGLDGAPEDLLARALQSGVALGPGDVVAYAPRPLAGAPEVGLDRARGTGRASTRRLLAESVLRGAVRPAYLRPGAPYEADADLLGAVRFRVVSPPGVQVPDAADLARIAGSDRAIAAP